MLTATLIARYGIAATYDSYAAADELFSGEGNDPVLSAENMAYDISHGGYFDITVAICPDGKCVTQVIIFRNKMGYDKYKYDNITLFDQKGI